MTTTFLRRTDELRPGDLVVEREYARDYFRGAGKHKVVEVAQSYATPQGKGVLFETAGGERVFCSAAAYDRWEVEAPRPEHVDIRNPYSHVEYVRVLPHGKGGTADKRRVRLTDSIDNNQVVCFVDDLRRALDELGY